MKNNNPQPRY